jgi:CheY-like chemotaxis protein
MVSNNEEAKPVILVAENEPLLRLYAADLLEEHRFEVVEAEDAAPALSVMENRSDVRLLFTDIQMPGRFDGMDLAGRCMHAGLASCCDCVGADEADAPRFLMTVASSPNPAALQNFLPRSMI